MAGGHILTVMLPLTTERLRLRALRADDLPFLLEVHQHPELRRFIPSAACSTIDDARIRLARFALYSEEPVLGFPCVERHDGVPVGLLMVKPIPPSGHGLASSATPPPGQHWDIEIGWRGHPDHSGQGYITEAARAAFAHAFAHGLRRIVAVTDPDNLASQRVAERAGMHRLGLTSAYYDSECVLFEARAAGA